MEDALSNLKVVKRNGKKVDFDSMKIAVAIKKGFDDAFEKLYLSLLHRRNPYLCCQ